MKRGRPPSPAWLRAARKCEIHDHDAVEVFTSLPATALAEHWSWAGACVNRKAYMSGPRLREASPIPVLRASGTTALAIPVIYAALRGALLNRSRPNPGCDEGFKGLVCVNPWHVIGVVEASLPEQRPDPLEPEPEPSLEDQIRAALEHELDNRGRILTHELPALLASPRFRNWDPAIVVRILEELD